MTAGYPDAAARIRAARERISARALEIALEHDRTMGGRYDELALRRLLRDAGAFLERIASSTASGDPMVTEEFADGAAPMYRRRRVPMDDLINIAEGLRQALLSVLTPTERVASDRAIDAAIATLRRYRRIAGDASKRNPILAAIYKGA
jgi:hypothetical protein